MKYKGIQKKDVIEEKFLEIKGHLNLVVKS